MLVHIHIAPDRARCHTPPVYDDLPAELFDFHHSLLVDEVRTTGFLRALLQQIRPGDVVVDLGTGTGILSMFAVIAGASRVYAIEHGPMAEVAREIARRNGVENRVTIITDWSTEATLPELADVLITETIGNIGFEEGILTWVLDATKRLLKPDGTIVPERISLVAAAVESRHDYAEIARLRRPVHELDFSALTNLATHSILWTDLSPVSVVTKPATVTSVDLAAIEHQDVAGSITVNARRDALVHGIGCWFVAEIAPGISMSNQPPTATPSWDQGFLPLLEPLHVEAGDPLTIEIQSGAGCSRWGWSLGLGEVAALTWTTSMTPLTPPPRGPSVAVW